LLVLAPVTLAIYLTPPPPDVLTLEPVRNIAQVVVVDRLVVEDTIQVFFGESCVTIDSESFVYRLPDELPRRLNVYDLCPLLLSELAFGLRQLELHECEHWRYSSTPKQAPLRHRILGE